MKNTSGQIVGITPKGNRFFLSSCRLEWAATSEVGSICIPLKEKAPLEQIAHEIETTGQLSASTRRKWLAC